MLKNKFKRHTISVLTLVLASIFLYPVAQAGIPLLTWFLLGLVLIAALTTLTTK